MKTPLRFLAAVLALAAGVATLASAAASDHREGRRGHHEDEEHEHEGRARAAAAPASASPGDPGAEALYRKECGACHLAFPPGMLSADAHRRTLAGLERHFGQNAELDAPVRDRLERFLVANAGGSGGGLRVTEQPRFVRKHRRIGPDVVARPAVKTLANCAACHAGAQDWDFEEDRVKIPR
jgi:hypothetical protein